MKATSQLLQTLSLRFAHQFALMKSNFQLAYKIVVGSALCLV